TRKQDQLLHHPYDSFLPLIEFLRQAAADPQVMAIKQTLYRTGADSAIVDALVDAARAGKEVTVVVEVRARFDEADNIDLANRLQQAGAHVVYGIVGYKAHAKLLLVVRRADEGLRHYAHLGTGNYHPRTARLYEDYGLFTCDEAICNDVHNVFLQLTSLGKVAKGQKLLQSPFDLHRAIIEKIERETANARAGRPARIILKVNNLVEAKSIEALYAASGAGVQIDLIVRGMCCLRPGLAGVSENIRVRSVIGRFLEHSRVYYFENGGEPELFCSSADWMPRNFFHRVEVAFPVTEPALRQRIIGELQLYLEDNTQAWTLDADGSYALVTPDGDDSVGVQKILMDQASKHDGQGGTDGGPLN
ncbi:MAG TPA: polyphosphate kinase 1, partial [Gammaproteobacteria bacterium]|nr:polyphosphate kinase 1 [Gammaproteobacteria bacterium]